MNLIYDVDPEFFEERAAIRQFDGGMTPAEARIAALRDVLAWQEAAGAWLDLEGEVNVPDGKPLETQPSAS